MFHNKYNTPINFNESMYPEIKRIKTSSEMNNDHLNLNSGFADIDDCLGGFRPGNVYLIVSYPCCGKTAFLTNILANITSSKSKALFICPSMSNTQATQRFLACISGIRLEEISRGIMDDISIQLLINQMLDAKEIADHLLIWDYPAIRIKHIKKYLTSLSETDRPKIIVIDDVNLIRSKSNENSINKPSNILQKVRELAETFAIPIIVGQGMKDPKKKESKFPQLRDLSKNGIYEQFTDAVLFLYRPEYYNFSEEDNSDFQVGETHVRIAKNRQGPLDTIKIKAEMTTQKFMSWDDEDKMGAYKKFC